MTDKQLDDKIKKMTGVAEISYPENYDVFIQNVLNRLPGIISMVRKKKKKGRGFPRPMFRVAMVLSSLLILLISVPVGAMVQGYMQRMVSMEDGQIKEYRSELKESQADADSYSRQLTSEEQERKEELLVFYEAGERYPEREITAIREVTQVLKDRVCFLVADSKFYLPEQRLSDEDLLEIIDFYHKRDYSLAQNHTQEAEKEIRQAGVSTDEILNMASKWVRKIYGEDVKNWERKVEMKETIEAQKKYYNVIFENSKEHRGYLVTVDKNNFFGIIQTSENKKNYSENVSVTKEQTKKAYKNILSVYKRLGMNDFVERVSCDYNQNEERDISHGIMRFLFEQKENQGYVLHYSFNTRKVYNIEYVEDMSLYKETKTRNIKVLKEKKDVKLKVK